MKGNSNLTKLTAIVLVLSLVFGTVASIIVEASGDLPPSFDYIETIKREKNEMNTAFTILEIAPDKNQGAMGYLAEGQEPVANWTDELAGKTSSARKIYVDNLMSQLTARNLLGTGDTAPLKNEGAYTEYYPWNKQGTELKLSDEETQTIRGHLVPAEEGSYTQSPGYSLEKTNMFNIQEWYDDLLNNSGNNPINKGRGSLSLVNGCVVMTVKADEKVGDGPNDFYTRHDGNYYKMQAEPNTEYTLSFDYEAFGDAALAKNGQIFVFEYTAQGTTWKKFTNDYTPGNRGKVSKSITFTTQPDTNLLGFRIGTSTDGTYTGVYSNIKITRNAETPQYVQDVEYYTYLNNLFSFDDFKSNIVTKHNNSNVVFNSDYSIDISDSAMIAENWRYEEAESGNFYAADVIPGTTYTFSFTTQNKPTISSSSTQSRVRLVGLCPDDDNEVLVEDYNISSSGTHSYTFKAGEKTTKVGFMFGVGANTKVTFSNILLSDDGESDGKYFYNVEATEIDVNRYISEDVNYIPDGTVIYTKVSAEDAENNPLLVEGTYIAEGALMSDGTGATIDIYEKKYTLKAITQPYSTYSPDHPYYANSKDFVPASAGETAWFYQKQVDCTYVGEGLGSYDLITSSSDPFITVHYKVVYFTGGFSNNNWFKYKVLDGSEDDAFPVAVVTVTPDDMEQELSYWLSESVDLVVIDKGLALDGSAISWGTKDFSQETYDRLVANYGDLNAPLEVPIMYDSAILNDASAPGKVKNFITNVAAPAVTAKTTNKGGVKTFIYAFAAADISSAPSYVASNKFCTNITESFYRSAGTAYNDVYQDIYTENLIRDVRDEDLLTYSNVSEATSIRYILNYAGRRVMIEKDTYNILDIEPYTSGTVFDTVTHKIKSLTDAGLSNDDDMQSVLTESKVKKWLPNGKLTYLDSNGNEHDAKIKIDTVASSALVGDVDDIAETYDLVYVGDSSYNMYTATITDESVPGYGEGEIPVYNDKNMNGYYYSSIGDIYYTVARTISGDNALGGLTSDDYTWIPFDTSDYQNNIDDYDYEISVLRASKSGKGLIDRIKIDAKIVALEAKKVVEEVKIAGLGVLGNVATSIASALKNNGNAVTSYAFLEAWNPFKVRSSGNDLTEKKAIQLEDFARTGLPVVIADELVEHDFEGDIRAEVTGSGFNQVSSGNFKTTFSAKLTITTKDENGNTVNVSLPSSVKPVYTWYHISYTYDEDGNAVPGTESLERISEENMNSSKTGASDTAKRAFYIRNDANNKTSYLDSYFRNTYNNSSHEYETNYEKVKGYYFVQVEFEFNGRIYRDFKTLTLISNTSELYNESRTFKVWMKEYNKQTWWSGIIHHTAHDYSIEYVGDKPENLGIIAEYQWKEPNLFSTGDVEYYGNPYPKCEDSNPYCQIYLNGKLVQKIMYHSNTHGIDHTDSGNSSKALTTKGAPIYQSRNQALVARTHLKSNPIVYDRRIDNTSYMFNTLDNILDTRYGRNVFVEESLRNYSKNKVKLTEYLALSSPTIVVTESSVKAYPEVITDFRITANFTVQNPTDTSITTTNYRYNFYMDRNSDGKFSADELTQAHIYEGGTEVTRLYATGTSTSHNYRLEVNLPDGVTGILPWKLEIINNANSGFHDTYVNYGYVRPAEATIIKTLQVLPSDWDYVYKKNGSKGVDDGNTYVGTIFESDAYKNLLGRNWKQPDGPGTTIYMMFGPTDSSSNMHDYTKYYEWYMDQDNKAQPTGNEVPDFFVIIDFKNVKELNNLFRDSANERYFDNFDMLVLGFADSWGRAAKTKQSDLLNTDVGLNKFSAFAIQDYIDSGKAILLTHDLTTSYNNFVDNVLLKTIYGTLSKLEGIISTVGKLFNPNFSFAGITDDDGDERVRNGYWVNLLRDSCGLDRYGATYAIKEKARVGNGYIQFSKVNDEGITEKKTYALESSLVKAGIPYITDKQMQTLVDQGWEFKNGGLNSDGDFVVMQGSILDSKEDGGYTLSLGYYTETYKANHSEYDKIDERGNHVRVNPSSIYSSGTTLGSVGRPGQSYYYNTETQTMLSEDYSVAWVPGTAITEAEYNALQTSSPAQQRYKAKYALLREKKSLDSNNNEVTERMYAQTDNYIAGFARHDIVRHLDTEEAAKAKKGQYNLPNKSMMNFVSIIGTGKIAETKYITQTNKGQISTYPYDINLYKDGHITDINGGYEVDPYKTYEVKNTHEQYYQMNMNGDDVTVWYCMNGENFGDIANDATNCYYIYSRNNVTYTGAGHTNTFTPNEAKLFANTLIAAYRPSAQAPEVSFHTQENGGIQNYKLLSGEYNDDGSLQQVDTDYLYFKVSDVNVGEKEIHADIYYIIDEKKDNKDAGGAVITLNDSGKINFTVDGTTYYAAKYTDGQQPGDYLIYTTDGDRNAKDAKKAIGFVTTVDNGDSKNYRFYFKATSGITGTAMYLDEDWTTRGASVSEVESGTYYRFYIPQEIIDKLSSGNRTSLNVSMVATTLYDKNGKNNKEPYYSVPGDCELELRKLGLRELS